MSSFSLQPFKVLLTIAESLYETDFNYDDPWDEADENYNLFKDASRWVGMNVEYEDMEFMASLMNINEPLLKQLSEKQISKQQALSQITPPELKKFKIYYEIWGPATLTERYSTTWESYDKSWVRDSLRYSYNEGDFSAYDGNYEDYETDNFEADNFEITDTREMRESKKPILSKLVMENTKDVLDNLDKETLIELRNLINQKLSSF
jgi:hypothetical protein